jgi:hypothetical protein
VVELGVQVRLLQHPPGLLLKKPDLLRYHGQLAASASPRELKISDRS